MRQFRLQGDDAAGARAIQFRQQGVGVRLSAAMVQGQVVAVRVQATGDCGADPAGGAGDQCDGALRAVVGVVVHARRIAPGLRILCRCRPCRPPMTTRLRTAPAWERIGATLSLPFAGVHVIEATKQVYRPAMVRKLVRIRGMLEPILVPSGGTATGREPPSTA